MTFETLGLSPALLRALAENSYTTPTPIQLESIPLALAGHDDPVCPPQDLQAIAAQAPRGSYAQVHGRHLCNLESPYAFNDALLRFLLQ